MLAKPSSHIVLSRERKKGGKSYEAHRETPGRGAHLSRHCQLGLKRDRRQNIFGLLETADGRTQTQVCRRQRDGVAAREQFHIVPGLAGSYSTWPFSGMKRQMFQESGPDTQCGNSQRFQTVKKLAFTMLIDNQAD